MNRGQYCTQMIRLYIGQAAAAAKRAGRKGHRNPKQRAYILRTVQRALTAARWYDANRGGYADGR